MIFGDEKKSECTAEVGWLGVMLMSLAGAGGLWAIFLLSGCVCMSQKRYHDRMRGSYNLGKAVGEIDCMAKQLPEPKRGE